MEIYHSYFKYWRNFPDKTDFTWVAITKTIPRDFIGSVYPPLAPIGERFDYTLKPVFNERLFIKEYAKLLTELDRTQVINDLKSFSKRGKDVVILNWEDMSKFSEGRFAYAWMFKMSMKEANLMDLENVLEKKKVLSSLTGMNFLTL